MSDIDSDSTTVQPYDSAVETKVSGLAGTMLGGKKRRRRTRGKRHTLKKAHKVKSRKLKSRRAKDVVEKDLVVDTEGVVARVAQVEHLVLQ